MPLSPPASEILSSGSGDLSGTPFPLLLGALFVDGRSVCLELKKNTLEKRVFFEEGVPVICTTNLLHETLGRFLVREEKITDKQYQAALAQSTSTGIRMDELLVQRELLTPYELFRLMQKSLALKILDCFRWTSGKWRLLLDVAPVGTPLKINPAQLLLTGCTSSMPYAVATEALGSLAGERFALVPDPPQDAAKLKLSGKDSRLLKVFEEVPDMGTLLMKSALEDEEVLRRLYAFLLLGFVATPEEVAKMAPVTDSETTAPRSEVSAPSLSTGRPGRSPDEVRNDILGLFLKYRDQDAFDLLGLAEDANFAEMRAAYLAFAERVAPWAIDRKELGDVADKAEMLFLVGARAFGELCDAERREACLRRRRTREAEAKERKKGPDFQIRTDLLDGDTQFTRGKELFERGELAGAAEHFQYAVDIDPKPVHRVWLGWARFKQGATVEALDLIEHAVREAPREADAFYFLGEVRLAADDLEGARAVFKRAVQLAPNRPDFARALAELG